MLFISISAIIHLDFKPENLIYVKEGNNLVLKAIDFEGCKEIAPYAQSGNVKVFFRGRYAFTDGYSAPEISVQKCMDGVNFVVKKFLLIIFKKTKKYF